VATDVSVVGMAAVGSSEGAVIVSSGDANGDIRGAAGVGDVLVVRDWTTADQAKVMRPGSDALTR
jgi:hypothetical protein